MASKSQIITPFDADMIMHLIELRSVKAAVNRANASGDPDTLPAHARYFYNMAADLVAQQLTIKSPNPCPDDGRSAILARSKTDNLSILGVAPFSPLKGLACNQTR